MVLYGISGTYQLSEVFGGNSRNEEIGQKLFVVLLLLRHLVDLGDGVDVAELRQVGADVGLGLEGIALDKVFELEIKRPSHYFQSG